MQGYPYEIRLRLSDDVPADGQFKVMKRLPVYDGAEVCNVATGKPAPKSSLRVAVFNMEHGNRNREIIPFVQTCKEMKDVDILFANELDDGTLRSGNIDTAREIASALNLNYAYGLEFIELVNPLDEKGYEGNAVFSRYPIVRADVLHLPVEYEWYYSTQKRIGARVAVFAELDLGDRHIGAVSIHLENGCMPAGRANQINAILRKAAEFFGDMPVIMGGDYNFNSTNFYDPKERATVVAETRAGIFRDPVKYEASFALYEHAGYDYKNFNNSIETRTGRALIDGEWVFLHIDWIFAKGVTCLDHGVISTLTEDCKKWAPADSPIQSFDGKQISDHNAVWAECLL